MKDLIKELRLAIYQNYDFCLKQVPQRPIDSPDHLENDDYIFCTDIIEDPRFNGKTYLAGKILSREKISGDGFRGIVMSSEGGIIPFEEYAGIDIKPVFALPNEQGLVVNKSSIEKYLNDPIMKGMSVDEIIRLNFAFFAVSADKARELSEEDYVRFYAEAYSKNPILF